MSKAKKQRPFPHREYEVLQILNSQGMRSVLDIQAELVGADPEGRHAFRALERLRAFGHVARKKTHSGERGRPEFQYRITTKGEDRLVWMADHVTPSKAKT